MIPILKKPSSYINHGVFVWYKGQYLTKVKIVKVRVALTADGYELKGLMDTHNYTWKPEECYWTKKAARKVGRVAQAICNHTQVANNLKHAFARQYDKEQGKINLLRQYADGEFTESDFKFMSPDLWSEIQE